MERQDSSAQRGVLPRKTTKRHEPPRYRLRFRPRHLPPGFPNRDPNQELKDARTEGILPRQVVLHVQHAHHARVGIDEQRVFDLANARWKVPGQLLGQDARCLGSESRFFSPFISFRYL